MCGRFTLIDTYSLKETFGVLGETPEFKPSYNIAPGTVTPVVTRNSPNKIELMKWGLIPFWAKDPKIGYKMINARAEGIADKPAFRKAIRGQRCLVPASGFYEWSKVKIEAKAEKIPFYFRLNDREVFAFAGLFDEWKDAEGREIRSYTIITTEANTLMMSIHDRMPVVLTREDEDDWLDFQTPLDRVLDLLKPYPSEKMERRVVSRLVNNPVNNAEDLIKPV